MTGAARTRMYTTLAFVVNWSRTMRVNASSRIAMSCGWCSLASRNRGEASCSSICSRRAADDSERLRQKGAVLSRMSSSAVYMGAMSPALRVSSKNTPSISASIATVPDGRKRRAGTVRSAALCRLVRCTQKVRSLVRSCSTNRASWACAKDGGASLLVSATYSSQESMSRLSWRLPTM